MAEFVKVAKTSDIAPNNARGFSVEGKNIMIASIDGKLYAAEDRCSHMNSKLSTGLLSGNVIMCMAHGAQFDITTGKQLGSIGKGPIKTYEVRVSGDDIEVKIE